MFREFQYGNNVEDVFKYIAREAYSIPKRDRQKTIVGLRTEFEFYNTLGKELNLEPALDYSNHVDFTGVMDGKLTRIDVTTNQDFKNMKDYLPFVDCGQSRYVALKLGNNKFKLISMNFPPCPKDDGGRLFDIVLLSEIGGTEKRPFEGSLTQYVIRACSVEPEYHNEFVATYEGFGSAPSYVDDERLEFYMGQDFFTHSKAEIEVIRKKEIDRIVDSYVRFFKSTTKANVVILAEDEYFFVTNIKDYDGFTGTKIWWIEDVVKNSVSEYDFDNIIF